MFKKLFYLILVVALLTCIWVAFALWTGMYSVYSYPPSPDHPNGATLLVSREPGEPMFNSPDAKQPPKKKSRKSGGIGFGGSDRPPKPIGLRTIVELPYIRWAYEKSLEDAQAGE